MKKLILLLVVLLVSSLSWAEESLMLPMPSALSKDLPWFAVREAKSGNSPFTKSHLAEFAKKSDRVALVYFATWCVPCRAGVKRLASARKELVNNRVSVVLVNIGEDEQLVKKWIDGVGASSFKVIADPFKRMTEGFGLVKVDEEIALPKTLVLDGKLKPLFLIGQEGSDWPDILWEK